MEQRGRGRGEGYEKEREGDEEGNSTIDGGREATVEEM